MKRVIEIELDVEDTQDDFLDKLMGRIYTMSEVKKGGMTARFLEVYDNQPSWSDQNDRRTNTQS